MKNHSQYLMKLTVGLTILLGLIIILFINEWSFKKIVADDIENISKLSSSIIYSEIDNSLTKPIFVGLTIANDLFLKNWLEEESAAGATVEQTNLMQQYLSGYYSKYGYDSVAVTSQKSGIYYYQDGVNKVISKGDRHDVWYYDFIETDKSYDLDVDFDEANNQELTVFINCKITNSSGEPLGAVGVGIKMSHLRLMLQQYETEYDLSAYIINDKGLIQIDSDEENIETVNFFDNPKTLPLKDKIVNNKDEMQIFWYNKSATDHCIITKYISNLEWYIVIDKDTSAAQMLLTRQINHDLLLVGIIITIVLLIISFVIGKYNRILLKTATVDDVTNLPNIKMFQEIFNRNSKRSICSQGILFMFDVDFFKQINDQFGHLYGNMVLYHISETTKNIIGNKGIIARWGGDEFVGTIYTNLDDAAEMLKLICDQVSAIPEHESITVSLGATAISSSCTLDSLIHEADLAMYRSKENGRGQITFYKE